MTTRKKKAVPRTAPVKGMARCEWCDEPASYRITARVATGPYKRFACDNVYHRDRTDQNAAIDLGALTTRTSMTNPTGFALKTGRVLGP